MREIWTLVPIVLCMFWIGLYPAPFFKILDRPVQYVVQKVDPGYMDKEQLAYPPLPVAPPHGEPEHAQLQATPAEAAR